MRRRPRSLSKKGNNSLISSRDITSIVRISPSGQVTVAKKERKESRYNYGGVVFIQAGGGRQIRASGRDLSLHGVGIRIHQKLKSYAIGSRIELEFAYPHELSGLLIEVELRRVRVDERGFNDCGFQIVSSNKLLNTRLHDLISSLEAADPW